jgi:hypothetical protein
MDLGYITVTARLKEQDGRWLYFTAEVCDQKGRTLARAKATHWILNNETTG